MCDLGHSFECLGLIAAIKSPEKVSKPYWFLGYVNTLHIAMSYLFPCVTHALYLQVSSFLGSDPFLEIRLGVRF